MSFVCRDFPRFQIFEDKASCDFLAGVQLSDTGDAVTHILRYRQSAPDGYSGICVGERGKQYLVLSEIEGGPKSIKDFLNNDSATLPASVTNHLRARITFAARTGTNGSGSEWQL